MAESEACLNAVFCCHFWTVPSLNSRGSRGGICWPQLNISGETQRKNLVVYGLTVLTTVARFVLYMALG